MKTTILLLFAALTLPAILAGCGSSAQTVPLDRHTAVTDSLQREITAAKSLGLTLRDRVGKLEQERTAQAMAVADCESTVTFLKSRLAQAPPPAPAVESGALYPHALALFRSKVYAEAERIFQSVLAGGGDPSLRDNCMYWIGECKFALKEYDGAIGYFQKVLPFEKSEKKDESQLMIARSYAKMGKKEQAKIEYQKLIDGFPASPFLEQAKVQMTGLH